jgi:uncharacterized phage protein (predicted DNA packaging)
LSLVTVADAKAHLNIVDDADDELIAAKIEAAESWVAAFTGSDFADDEAFPDGAPAPVLEAIRKLVADLYEHRESSDETGAPFGVADLLAPYRKWTF